MVRLAYVPKKKKWRELEKGSEEYEKKEIKGYKVIRINKKLWFKVKNMIKIKATGWDSILLIDGMRRSGKSTLGKTIAYLIDPDMTIKNIIAGLKDSFTALETIKENSVLMFDESSLSFSSKDAMKKAQGQLLKIIDVIGQKRLTLIFIIPSFFNLNRAIAVDHSLFLLHVYPDKTLKRGQFAYFGTKKKKFLYSIGKKNFNSYKKPQADFIGLFEDFIPTYEKEYLELKKDSLREALGLKGKDEKPLTEGDWRRHFIRRFVKNCPDIMKKDIARGFDVTPKTISECLKVIPKGNDINN